MWGCCDMAAWIIGIVGTVLTVTLTEVMLPEGNTSKFIKGVISLMVIYVVIAPIPALLRSEIDINSFFDFAPVSYESDADFIEIIKEDKQSALTNELNDAFVERGITARVRVVLDEDYSVKQVFLTVTDEDLDEAYRLTIGALSVKEEKIVINEVFT